MKNENTIGCIVCGDELDNETYKGRDGDLVEVHPMDGLHFRAYGNYGSVVFDPVMTGEYIDIAVCDQCIMKNLDKVRGTGIQNLAAQQKYYFKDNIV
jgi:hypothetical protein